MQLQSTLLFGSLGFTDCGSPTPKNTGIFQAKNKHPAVFMVLARMKHGEKRGGLGLLCDFFLELASWKAFGFSLQKVGGCHLR